MCIAAGFAGNDAQAKSLRCVIGCGLQAPIIEDDYRAHFTRPVGRFYERLLERSISAAEWDTLDRVFESLRNGREEDIQTVGEVLTAWLHAIVEVSDGTAIIAEHPKGRPPDCACRQGETGANIPSL